MSGLPLAVEGLKLAFGQDPVIDIAALTLRPGSMTVLSGPSGAGKSTLLYLLSGLLRADSGTLLWGETDLRKLGEGARDRWRRKNAGFIFQDFHLIDEMSPLDNVVVSAWFSGWSAGGLRPRGRQLLASLHVPQARNSVALLSRGERQRVAIARALVTNPKVLFADEPTASLDAKAGAQVADILRDAAHTVGRTVVVASHDPVVIGMADQLVTLRHGEHAAISMRIAA